MSVRTIRDIDAELAALRLVRERLREELTTVMRKEPSYASRYVDRQPVANVRGCSHPCRQCSGAERLNS